MATETVIGKPLPDSSPTGTSFELELRGLLIDRCRLVFSAGLAISGALLALHEVILQGYPRLASPLSAWHHEIYLAHPVSFALALVATYLGRREARSLQNLAFLVLVFNLVLAIFHEAAFTPERDPLFSISLLLFIPAAVMPWREYYQIGLALSAVLTSVTAPALLYVFLPETASFWAGHGGQPAFRMTILWTLAGTTILAGSSILVTRTLYRLRKSVHHAQRLGNYLIQEEIGRGGMGRVFMARHALMCRPTALKVLRNSDENHRSAAARFEREARLSSTLTHPNTITIYDFGRTSDDTFYYAMEYLQGMDLQRLIARFGPLPAARAVAILIQVCGSLAEAHERNIIHRDIKPSNIFLTLRGGLYDFVKVLDFGVAKQIRQDVEPELTQPGVAVGTPRYFAPEAIRGSGALDARADIYNLGGVAYWTLTGHETFESSSKIELIIDHARTRPKRPSEVSEMPIPKALDDIVMKCLEKDPDDRFQAVGELEAALRAIHFETPWTQSKAREWWRLHAPEIDVSPSFTCREKGDETFTQTEVMNRRPGRA
jgi:tRNA A-37 threonylcarbamoyl transferase component Bud32